MPSSPFRRFACAVAGAAALLAAPAAAGAASTFGAPSGAFSGQPPRAWVLTIHGGGWYRVGPRMAARMDADAARLNSWGYATVNVDYRAGALAYGDVAAAYDALRRDVGSRVPICAYGASAGGHLALMLAIRNPALACVVAQAPPTVLASLAPRLRRLATRAFGAAGGLDAWSPARHPLRTPLLLEQARHDPVVGFSNSVAMHRADPRSRLVALEPGTQRWVHASVDPAQLARLHARERVFLARWTTDWSADAPLQAPSLTGRRAP